MSDFVINDPSLRVTLYQPITGYDNIYIVAKDVYVNTTLDVSEKIAGGAGGAGGTATNVGDTPNLAVGGEWGYPGVTGLGYNPAGGTTGGVGGSAYIDNLSGMAGADGQDGSSMPTIAYIYDAFSPLSEILVDYQQLIATGSSGRGGGGGAAGNTYKLNCKDYLVGGSGGGGGAGGPAGGNIILIAEDTLEFGPDTTLISKGSLSGSNGADGEYIWDETTVDGVVTTRNIQLRSGGATLAGAAGAGGTGIGGDSEGGDGGYGGLNYREADEGLSSQCLYTQELADQKRGGKGGDGGAGSGGNIFAQSSAIPALPATNVQGGISRAFGFSISDGKVQNTGSNNLNNTISLKLAPSSSPAYAYFDYIVAGIETDSPELTGSNAVSQFSTDSYDSLFRTNEGTPINSVVLLNHVFTATDTGDVDPTVTATLSSSTNTKWARAIAVNPAQFFTITPSISSGSSFTSGNDIVALRTDSFTFSGITGGERYPWVSLGAEVGTDHLSATIVHPFVTDNKYYAVSGEALYQSASGNSLTVTVQPTQLYPNSTVLHSDPAAITTPDAELQSFVLTPESSQAAGVNELVTVGTALSTVSSFFLETQSQSALQSDSTHYVEYVNSRGGAPNTITEKLSVLVYDDFITTDGPVTTFHEIITGGLSVNVDVSATQSLLSEISSLEASGKNGYPHVYPVDHPGNQPSSDDFLPGKIASEEISGLPAGNEIYKVGSYNFLSGTEFLDYTSNFFFSVSTDATPTPGYGNEWVLLSANLSTATADYQAITAVNISKDAQGFPLTTESLGVTAGSGTSGDENIKCIFVDLREEDMVEGNPFEILSTYPTTLSANLGSNPAGYATDPVGFINTIPLKRQQVGATMNIVGPESSPGVPAEGIYFDVIDEAGNGETTSVGVSGYLFEQDKIFQILYESPNTNIIEDLSSSQFTYTTTGYSVRIPLSGDHNAPIEGWLYDTSGSEYFFPPADQGYSPIFNQRYNDKAYVSITYDPDWSGAPSPANSPDPVFNIGTSAGQLSCEYNSVEYTNIRISPPLSSTIELDEYEVISDGGGNPTDSYIVFSSDTIHISLLSGENTIRTEYGGISAQYESTTRELSVMSPDVLEFMIDDSSKQRGVTATASYNSSITGVISGSYTTNASDGIDLEVSFPRTFSVDVPGLSATMSSITAERHRYSLVDLSDDTIYGPYNDFNYAYNNNEAYLGYAILSSVWTPVGHSWYSRANVASWAPDTDLTQLTNLLGDLSGQFQDQRDYDSSLNVLVNQPTLQRAVFKGTDVLSIQHHVTAVPSGVDNTVYYDNIYALSAETNIVVPDGVSIDQITISPLTGYTNNSDNVTLSYSYSAVDGSTPTTIDWDVYFVTLNTNETESLYSGSAAYGANVVFEPTPTTYDVGQLLVSASNNIGTEAITAYSDNFYRQVTYGDFNLKVDPTSGYLSGTPFNFSTDLSPIQTQIISSIASPVDNIVANVTASIDYYDGYGALSASFPQSSADEFINRDIYYFSQPNITNSISSWAFVQYDTPASSTVYNGISGIYNGAPTVVGWPSATNLQILTGNSGACTERIGEDLYYLGGDLSLSGNVVADNGMPYVAEFHVSSSVQTPIQSTTYTNLTATIDFDSYLDESSVIEIAPNISIYPLLHPIDPNISDEYKVQYLSSGLGIQRYDFEPLYYVPPSFRPNNSNLTVTTTICSVEDSTTIYPTVTSTSNTYVSATIPFNQFDHTVDRIVNSTISFSNFITSFVSAATAYTIEAVAGDTTFTGSSSVDISFTGNVTGSVYVPVTASAGCVNYITSIEYYFDPKYIITPSMHFENTLPVSFAGCKSTQPLKVVVWDNVERDYHSVVLYSRGSDSLPWRDRNNRHEQLLPQWRFIDNISNTEVYSVSTLNDVVSATGQVVGVSGYSEIFYVDDLPTDSGGVLLVATLSTLEFATPLDVNNVVSDLPGFANSRLNAVLPYHINSLPPEKLDITVDGIRTHRPYYWRTTKIPYTVTLGSNLNPCSACSPILFNYPEVSGTETLYDIEIDSLSSTLFYIDSAFTLLDKDNLPVPGFVRGTLQPLVTGESVNMYSSATFTISTLNMFYPYVWVSNPDNKTLNRMMYDNSSIVTDYEDCIHDYTSSSILSADATIIQVPFISADAGEIISPDNTAMYISGFAGIYGMGIDSCYNVWAADSELDVAYKFDTLGNLITSIDFPFGSTPAGVAIDKSNDVYITTSDSVSTNKYSSFGNYITSLLPSDFSGHANEDAGENELYAPSQVEPDVYNNTWVAYTNPLCSCIIKYNNVTYSEDARITFSDTYSGTPIAPVDMVVDKHNNLHVINQFDQAFLDFDTRHYNGSYHVYNSSGTLLSSVTGLNNPHYITLDYNNDVWITQGVSNVSILSGNSFISYNLHDSTMTAGVTGLVEAAARSLTALDTENNDDTKIEGLGGTADGKVWAIHSQENRGYIIDADNTSLLDTFKIYPDDNIEWYNDSNYLGTRFYTVSNSWYRSAQAYGDWTGIRWATKYVFSATSQTITLTGTSALFNVEESPSEIRLINDSYNMGESVSNLFLSPHLSRENLPTFHGEYIDNVFGTDESDYSVFGRQVYEKIANFVKNHSDVEICNISQLYSVCEQLDIPIDEYIIEYPAELDRLMNMLSIHYSVLRGTKNKYNLNFGAGPCSTLGQYTTATDAEFTINREATQLTINDTVSSGDGIVLFDTKNNIYDVLYISRPSSSPTVAMSALTGYGLRSPLLVNNDFDGYVFYRYLSDNHTSAYANNLIDWDNSLNTLEFTTSSIEEWYGEYGILEKLFDYNIHKGLGFILSGIN